MILLLGRFSNSNNNSINNNNRRKKDVYLLLSCSLVLPINIKVNTTAKTISSKHYPHPPFTVIINIINPLLPLPYQHHLSLPVPPQPPIPIPTPSHVQEAPYSYANLSDAPNRIATRAISRLMG
jgi:hypothetical protein